MSDGVDTGHPEAVMRLAVDHLSDLIVVLTPQGRVVALNHGAAAWLGLTREDIIGRLLVDLADRSAVITANHALLSGMPWILDKVSRSAMPFAEDEMTLFNAEHRLVTASIRLDPLDLHGQHLVTWTVRLLDERRMIFRASTVAMARLDVSGRFLQANRALTDMVESTEEDLADTLLVDLVLPVDRGVWDAATAALGADGNPGTESEQRLVRRGGDTVWTRITRTMLPGSLEIDGVQLIVVQDVTARRQAEADAARSAADHRLLAQLATTALVAQDESSLIGDVEHTFRIGAAALSVSWTDGPPGADGDRSRDPGLPAATPTSWFTAAVTGVGADSHLRVAFASGRGVDDADVRDEESCRMLTEAAATILSAGLARIRAEDALRLQSLRDPLTGLANRRLLMDRLQDALEHRHERGHGVGVLFIDLDGFKAVNDGYGHDVGDQLLVAFAQRLRALVRSSDVVARWGGDEFVVVVQRLAGDVDMATLAERITREAAQPFLIGGRNIRVGASVGVGVSRENASVDELLGEADESMYRIKRTRGTRR